METLAFRCDIEYSVPNKPLNFRIELDGNVIYETDGTEETVVNVLHNFVEDNDDHILNFYLSGKKDHHTVLDSDGTVVESAQVILSNIKFDEINLTEMLLSNDGLMTYTHDRNGGTAEITQVFDPIMGFNGVATLKFKTPIYLWLLEYM